MKAFPALVVGLPYEGRLAYIKGNVNAGDRINLEMELDNPKSSEAVAAYHNNQKIGYIPKNEPWILECLEEGQNLTATACRLRRGRKGGITLLIFICHGKSDAAYEMSRKSSLETFRRETRNAMKFPRPTRFWLIIIFLVVVLVLLNRR